MASLRSSTPLLISSSCSCSSSKRSSVVVRSAINLPKLPSKISFSKSPAKHFLVLEEFTKRNGFSTTIPIIEQDDQITTTIHQQQLHALLEAVSDRIEMHDNIAEQRNNWNSLLLNSITAITLAATTMSGINASSSPSTALAASSALLFSAATALLILVNKIQPSQLAEEQRNASRLLKQLHAHLKTKIALETTITKEDVKDVMSKLLALDRAYPLPLVGTMLEKFPATFKPAVWWPTTEKNNKNKNNNRIRESRVAGGYYGNGWSAELEQEMRDIVSLIKARDVEEYKKLGNIVLKVNKVLAVSGPILTGIGAAGAALSGVSQAAAVAGVIGGAVGGVVASIEHGGQVGMVVEMYRNCAGFFGMMEETIESTLNEGDVEKRENGEVFEMKIAVKLGRSLSQLRSFANSNCSSPRDNVHEFASKLF